MPSVVMTLLACTALATASATPPTIPGQWHAECVATATTVNELFGEGNYMLAAKTVSKLAALVQSQDKRDADLLHTIQLIRESLEHSFNENGGDGESRLSSSADGKNGSSLSKFIAEDATKKQGLTTSTYPPYPYAPTGYPNITTSTMFTSSTILSNEINGDCLSLCNGTCAPFIPLFSWLPMAKDGGPTTWKGKSAYIWSLAHTFPSSLKIDYKVFVTQDGIPLALEQNISSPAVGKVYSTIEFLTFVPTVPPGWDTTWAAMNSACLAPPRCQKPPATSSPINVTMFIFHPPHEYDIAGQDLGDAVGDNVFVCQDLLGGKPNATDAGYQWLTQWTVELLPWFGQYANCNGYGSAQHCASADQYVVGRETPEYMNIAGRSALQRQCGATDPNVGQWFSLPQAGECPPGVRPNYADPSNGGCSWRKAERVKTIDGGKCLIEKHNYTSLCATDRRAPFSSATKAFLAAFASSDASRGGCPELAI